MLLINEYFINNNLFSDYDKPKNQKLLEDYSLFLTNNIKTKQNFQKKANKIVNKDKNISAVIKIQTKWRQKKIQDHLNLNNNNDNEEEVELKKMLINNIVDKMKNKSNKVTDIFTDVINNCKLINQNFLDIKEIIYTVQKCIQRSLTINEKNILYKEYINRYIFNK